jgi:hypothetical protein
MKSYYGKLYVKKLESLDEMDRFIDTYDLPKSNHKDIKNKNPYRAITSND